MKYNNLKPHQVNAVERIKKQIAIGNRLFWFSMPDGFGINSIIINFVKDYLQSNIASKIIIITNKKIELNELKSSFCDNENNFQSITLRTYNNIKINPPKLSYNLAIFLHLDSKQTEVVEQQFMNSIIVAHSSKDSFDNGIFNNINPIFKYSPIQAIQDGVISANTNSEFRAYAAENFCISLFESLIGGLDRIDSKRLKSNSNYDLSIDLQKEIKTIGINIKLYRDQTVKYENLIPVIKRMAIDHTNCIKILIVFCEISGINKSLVYKLFGVTVWDISNLYFYAQNNLSLLVQLSRLPYNTITNITPIQSEGWLPPNFNEDKETILQSTSQKSTTDELIKRLEDCKLGKKYFSEYEKCISEIITFLFDGEFSNVRKQNATGDKLFRMDMICALSSDKLFWRIIKQHFNSHFIIIEAKNYNEKLEQNLIYVTEKYLYNTALRNVALIISRKGFSQNAKIAADGCLKEHGKLLLDITDKDLITMIKNKYSGSEPSDYLLEILENRLMSISK